jgi:transcriptional regulator with XRE-family HTH domain
MKEMTTGERLRELRGTRSQEEVAAAIGVSQSAICAYEKDERVPRDDVKKRIASYYKRSVAFIFF